MPPKKSISLARRFRNAFITGLLIFLPLGTTVFVLNFLLDLFKEPATKLAFQLGLQEDRFFFGLETLLAVVGLFVGILSLTLLGFLSNYVLGKFFIATTEKILDKVPFLSTVYRSVKQIVQTFGKENRAVFKEVVLIEYPRPNCFVLGFITSDASGETEEVTGRKLTNVFVPTTPNPTSGFLLLLPREDIFKLDMSVGDGMKMLISGGAVIPPRSTKSSKGKGRRSSSTRRRRSPKGERSEDSTQKTTAPRKRKSSNPSRRKSDSNS
ncbi:MAG: DUF502 domain-containing protein [Verrucomicrobiota bacterium]|nr:DUF502 domain-containing protein [Verrucomicrobiota bacterium]